MILYEFYKILYDFYMIFFDFYMMSMVFMCFLYDRLQNHCKYNRFCIARLQIHCKFNRFLHPRLQNHCKYCRFCIWGSTVWGSTLWGSTLSSHQPPISDLEMHMPVLKKKYRGPFNDSLFREQQPRGAPCPMGHGRRRSRLCCVVAR